MVEVVMDRGCGRVFDGCDGGLELKCGSVSGGGEWCLYGDSNRISRGCGSSGRSSGGGILVL